MTLRLGSLLGLVVLLCAPACGEKEEGSASDGGSSGAATASSTDGGSTDAGSTGAATEAGTGGGSTGAVTTGVDSTGAGSTTGIDVSGFERFRMSMGAGPCPPMEDCDGFVELLSTMTLRVEKFGDVGDPVTEVAISAEDYAAAVQVFADPALVALLDGPDPACNPPTDIFESMEVVIDGSAHDAGTTLCDQPPIAAARDKATALQQQYVP
jgi:hypothetical protein